MVPNERTYLLNCIIQITYQNALSSKVISWINP